MHTKKHLTTLLGQGLEHLEVIMGRHRDNRDGGASDGQSLAILTIALDQLCDCRFVLNFKFDLMEIIELWVPLCLNRSRTIHSNEQSKFLDLTPE